MNTAFKKNYLKYPKYNWTLKVEATKNTIAGTDTPNRKRYENYAVDCRFL